MVSKVPQINEILGTVDAARERAIRPNAFAIRLATLYTEIWSLLAASRFCLFFAVSFFIYQSKPGAWGFGDRTGRSYGAGNGAASSGLDQLKNRVVFTYGFFEAMFWMWVSSLSAHYHHNECPP